MKPALQIILAHHPKSKGMFPGGEVDEDGVDPLHMVSSGLISAVHEKDVKGVADSLRDAFELMESEPHEEYESEEGGPEED